MVEGRRKKISEVNDVGGIFGDFRVRDSVGEKDRQEGRQGG